MLSNRVMLLFLSALVWGELLAPPLAAAITGPYTANGNTLALYHFDETAGAADPGNPLVNVGTGGSSLNLTDTGGPDGRDNTGAGGYGAAAYPGFGSSINNLLTGSGAYSSGVSATAPGLLTSGTVAQSSLQGATGAFTYEALINTNGITAEQQIVAHDGSSTRGFLFRINAGTLDFYNGLASVNAAIPTTGVHAFAPNEWFHVAVSYNGNEGVAGNLTFYWTRLDDSIQAANALTASGPMLADVISGSNNFGVGTTTRSPFRVGVAGLIDEVRLSSVALGPNDFIFAVPEPSTLLYAGLAGMVALGMTRRRQG